MGYWGQVGICNCRQRVSTNVGRGRYDKRGRCQMSTLIGGRFLYPMHFFLIPIAIFTLTCLIPASFSIILLYLCNHLGYFSALDFLCCVIRSYGIFAHETSRQFSIIAYSIRERCRVLVQMVDVDCKVLGCFM